MKLVLTSAGITNKSIENELRSILGKGFKGVKLLFCPTASNYHGGEMNEWLIHNLAGLKKLGFSIDICDINGMDIERLLPRFEWADVLYFEGGNSQWLKSCLKQTGLEKHLSKLLETRVWIGSSAGSIVLSPTVANPVLDVFEDNIEGFSSEGLGFIDFQVMPHLNNEWYPNITEKNITQLSKQLTDEDGKKLYALDDNSTIFVDGKEVKVVSEGSWFEV